LFRLLWAAPLVNPRAEDEEHFRFSLQKFIPGVSESLKISQETERDDEDIFAPLYVSSSLFGCPMLQYVP
jgi:hypothetical protein